MSDSHLLRLPDFRLIVDFFKATEAGKGKPVDGNRANFADGRLIERRTAACFMNECEHNGTSGLSDDKLMKLLHVLRTTQPMVAWNQIEFDGI